MRKLFLPVYAALIFLPSLSLAMANPQLTEYFQKQIQTLNHSVTEAETVSRAGNASAKEMWYLNQFSLRLRAPIGFKIGGFATFQVVPETEMVFQRSNPDGWVNYRPGL